MYENYKQQLAPRKVFIKRLAVNWFLGFSICLLSLLFGMAGYHLTENMSWVDAFVNAAMILSGMGPVDPLHSNSGKIFAGCYAMFCGIIFLVIIAILFAPIYHRFFHKFHVNDMQR
jgi:hypothetical protein